jgi:hypothetical protein
MGAGQSKIGHAIMEATVFWKIFAIWAYLTFVAAFVIAFVVALDAQDRIHRDLKRIPLILKHSLRERNSWRIRLGLVVG